MLVLPYILHCLPTSSFGSSFSSPSSCSRPTVLQTEGKNARKRHTHVYACSSEQVVRLPPYIHNIPKGSFCALEGHAHCQPNLGM
ncbi:hypothetical protein B0H63DRAFT_476336 [Podospora didyma]|uniref:Uncharacterized protein n=1 Tax=Podospora didyma TaxID=330526 RepID=A0AAE0NHK1_9PEZI|nr:hypothetical protein B0H63DRAFT_476336 [Podospora didyma]